LIAKQLVVFSFLFILKKHCNSSFKKEEEEKNIVIHRSKKKKIFFLKMFRVRGSVIVRIHCFTVEKNLFVFDI